MSLTKRLYFALLITLAITISVATQPVTADTRCDIITKAETNFDEFGWYLKFSFGSDSAGVSMARINMRSSSLNIKIKVSDTINTCYDWDSDTIFVPAEYIKSEWMMAIERAKFAYYQKYYTQKDPKELRTLNGIVVPSYQGQK